MKLSSEGLKVLTEIFSIGSDRKPFSNYRLQVDSPDQNSLFEFCNLLSETPREEALQKFLERYPGFLTGLLGTADNTDLAVLFKPPVGTQYKFADFCILQAHQGGAVVQMVEIESSHEPLFTKAGKTSKRLGDALMQIEDWKLWISKSPVPYVGDLLRLVESLPLYSDYKLGDRGFRLTDNHSIKRLWGEFGGFNTPNFNFTIIIGRWSQLTQTEKQRVLLRNKSSDHSSSMFTYEQLARGANFRQEREDW